MSTEAQRAALERVRERYTRIGTPQREVCGSAILVQCFYADGGSIWLGIEPDGYTHS